MSVRRNPMPSKILILWTLLYACAPLSAAEPGKPFDAAAAFGARPSVTGLGLSPDGASVVYIAPGQGQAATAFTLSLAKGSVPKAALSSDGTPFRLEHCDWVSNQRLECEVYGVIADPQFGVVPISRILAVNADGSNLRVLSTRENEHTHGFALGGGAIIDWLPDEDGAVLMTRAYQPDDHLGTRMGHAKRGLGVDRIDTQTLAVTQVVAPEAEAWKFITDGRGAVRIVGNRATRSGGFDTGALTFLYQLPGSQDWKELSTYDPTDRTGFDPVAVDHDLNVAYGFKKLDGRLALYTVTLDGNLHESLVYSRPDVDVDGVMYVGRRHRVVGASYTTDIRQAFFFAPDIDHLLTSLHKALPNQPLLWVIDASVDENTLLVIASSDSDPGAYYIFDRKTHQLQTFLVARNQLEGVKLAKVKAITYPAADGTAIPAYLTLPPGREDAKGLPAIVLPHGGQSARDRWGFDWLSQFYAARGYAVLQPNFRGSVGYGDAWFQKNGFKSWRVAIGDVLAGGHWLVSQGIADPAKLGIVGGSYGGYAALQCAVADPTVFKAVVAIAPVTDLAGLKEEHRKWTDFAIVSEFVGEGPQMHEGSPLENASKIKVPVLLFHGALDRNVSVEQSKRMQAALTSAGIKSELVIWPDLDHSLEDSAARELILRRSDAFLTEAFAAAAGH